MTDEKSKAILLLNGIINDLRYRIGSTSDESLKDWLKAYEIKKAIVVLEAVKTVDSITLSKEMKGIKVIDNELQKSNDIWYKNHISLIKLDMKKMCDKFKKNRRTFK